MIDLLRDFLTRREPPASVDDNLETAVAALLVEAARMDDGFDAAERATIERLLAARFHLTPDAVHALVEQGKAAAQDSAHLFRFTRQICERISPEERVHILEMLWKVAYSDGVLDPHEDMLLRRVAGLIHVTDRDRAMARRRALDKLGLAS